MLTLKISLLVFILSIPISAQDFWEQTNGPSGTPITCFAINSPNQIMAGGPGHIVGYHGGVYYSSDNGNYWFQKGLAKRSISALAFNSEDHIFAGSDIGIFRSTDIGDNWVALSLTYAISSITINTSNHIFAGSGIGFVRSTDNGETWNQIINGLPDGFDVRSSAINSFGYVFAGGRSWLNGNWFCGIYRSTNNGDTWTRITSGIPNTLVNSLVINSNDHLFAGTDSYGVYQSVNDGNSWTQINSGLTNTTVKSLSINSIGYIYAGTEGGVFYSSNNGNNWIQITNDLPVNSIKSIATISNELIFAGTYDGIFVSSNNGTNWSMENKGLANTDFGSLIIDLNSNIFGGTLRDGVYYSTNNGNDWVQRNNGLGSLNVLSFATNSIGHIFAGSDGVYYSTNNGENWVQTSLNNHIIPTLVFNSIGHIFAGAYQSVYRSTDNGENWVEVSNGFTDRDVSSLAINSDGHIFAGTRGDGVFRSTDNGDTWTALNNGLYPLYGSALAINSAGDIFVCAANDVFRSTDNGNNWVQTSLSAPYLSSIAIDTSGIIYVGSDAYGVYRSTDNGDSWSEINESLSFKYVSSLAISNAFIFAGIRYGGIFKRSIYTTSVEDEKSNYIVTFSLSQNYPNPFNPVTSIQYAVSSTQFVTLKVYDVLGNEVAILVNEEKQAGTYEVEFNATSHSGEGRNLTSGIYFYQLKVGGPETSSLNGQAGQGFIETKKMILIK